MGARLFPTLALLVPFSVACGSKGETGNGGTEDAAAASSAKPDSGDGTNTASPDWASYGGDALNTRTNHAEKTISAANVEKLQKKWGVSKDVLVTSTPAVVDDVVYWSGWTEGVRATDAKSGDEIWLSPMSHRISGSPAVRGEHVYVAGGVFVYALARRTGKVEWKTDISNYPGIYIYSSPAIAGNTLVVGTASTPTAPEQKFRGNVVGLDLDDGKIRWRVDVTKNPKDDTEYGPGVSVWSSAAVDEARGLAIIGTGQSYGDPASALSDSLVAIDYESGKVAWWRQFSKNDVFTFASMRGFSRVDADVGAAPNFFSIGKRAVVGVGDKAGYYHVLDRETGDKVWRTELSVGTPLGGVMTSAAYDDGFVYVATNIWKVFGTVSDIQFTNPKNRCQVHALGAKDGKIAWMTDLTSVCIGGITKANGVVYAGGTDGTLHALDAKTGKELWSDQPADSFAGGITVSNGRLFTGMGFFFAAAKAGQTGGLFAYDLR